MNFKSINGCYAVFYACIGAIAVQWYWMARTESSSDAFMSMLPPPQVDAVSVCGFNSEATASLFLRVSMVGQSAAACVGARDQLAIMHGCGDSALLKRTPTGPECLAAVLGCFALHTLHSSLALASLVRYWYRIYIYSSTKSKAVAPGGTGAPSVLAMCSRCTQNTGVLVLVHRCGGARTARIPDQARLPPGPKSTNRRAERSHLLQRSIWYTAVLSCVVLLQQL